MIGPEGQKDFTQKKDRCKKYLYRFFLAKHLRAVIFSSPESLAGALSFGTVRGPQPLHKSGFPSGKDAEPLGVLFGQRGRSATQRLYQSRMFPVVFERGLPSQVKGAGLRTLSRRGSWVQIPPPALEVQQSQDDGQT